jgi:uncharacterized membrane protein
MPQSPVKKERIVPTDMIRGLAIIAMILGHIKTFTSNSHIDPTNIALQIFLFFLHG